MDPLVFTDLPQWQLQSVQELFLERTTLKRVILQDGMLTSVDDLTKEIAKQCNLQEHFRLQFMDQDFDNDFMNLMFM